MLLFATSFPAFSLTVPLFRLYSQRSSTLDPTGGMWLLGQIAFNEGISHSLSTVVCVIIHAFIRSLRYPLSCDICSWWYHFLGCTL
ncbi:hypothetical protein BDV41DRAFT_216068 [Aspergillus transmontanensis]|uniref:Uncharacterized protein n=1 Tax=Aspergillus transmontanensis TaxID=1034304 RepID=A0A5N6W184_9EURO|nr:hypothetical protein BDV41DRAFT_216068 [Aspergillus transmontanensis]